MLWWLLWSCSPWLPAPAATGSTVMFDTEAQADTLVLTKVVEQAAWYHVPPQPHCWGQASVASSSGQDFWLGITGCKGTWFWV